MSDPLVIEEGGYRWVTVDGELDSQNDEPAATYPDGTRWWYRAGKIHRADGPAVIWSNGVEEWFRDGQRHRDNAPARTYPDSAAVDPEFRGVQEFWQNGKLVNRIAPGRVKAYLADLEALKRKHFGGAA